MVASGDVQSYIGKFLCDVVDVLIHPRDGPSGRELSKFSYQLLAHKREGLSGTEIWIESDASGKVGDIRAVDYWSGGFFRSTTFRSRFESMNDARDYFTQKSVTDEQFEALKSGIKVLKIKHVYPLTAYDYQGHLRTHDPITGKDILPNEVYSYE